jgi:IS4 transposase
VICDHTIALTVFYSKQGYPKPLRRIRFKDPETGKKLVFTTNHLDLEPLTVCQLYKMHWQVELFFKWIKQHLRIKTFFGTSENTVKSQIWIAVCTYVLVAIVRKRLKLEASMHEMLQILSLSPFEKTSLDQLLTLNAPRPQQPGGAKPADFAPITLGQ